MWVRKLLFVMHDMVEELVKANKRLVIDFGFSPMCVKIDVRH